MKASSNINTKKRIASMLKVMLLTGLGYLATLMYTYLLIDIVEAEAFASINKYESILSIIMALVSLGAVQHATREIALKKNNWQSAYKESQNFRVFISIFIAVSSSIFFILTQNKIFLFGLATIPMALSGEYALYALGHPVEAAKASFSRAIIFSLLVISFSITLELNELTFIIASSISFIICGVIASKKLNTPYLNSITIPSQHLAKTIGIVAVIVFIYNNIKPAYILLISNGLSSKDNLYYFEAYKIYFVLFSVRRVIVQALYKEILTSKRSIKYDLIVTSFVITGTISLWSIKYLIDLFNIGFSGLSYSLLKDVSIMALMACIFPTSFTKLFALKKDLLTVLPIVASVTTIFLGIILLQDTEATISEYLLLLGFNETILSVISLLILYIHTNKSNQAHHRSFPKQTD